VTAVSAVSLAERLPGRVLTPADAGFASEIAGFNTAVVHRPDLVVAATSAADVREAMAHARAHGLRVAVQATGHGALAPIEGGLLVSLGRLDGVTVDPARKLATVGGGARWGAVIAAAAPHGLAPIAGSSPTVGVVGYLLGGGLGPLARSHGFSSDYLAALEVVTGEGQLVRASAVEHPDLFWALRGGKAGLGLVTAVELRLVELPALYAGALWFEEPHIEAALRGWIGWTAGADPQVSTSVAIVRFPPIEQIPAPLRGRRLLALRFAYPGSHDQGARLAAPLRALAPVHVDQLAPLALAEVARIHDDPTAPVPSFVAGTLLDRADQTLASVIVGAVGAGTDSPFIALEVRQLGEATRRDVPEGSAVGGRGAGFTLGLVCVTPPRFAEAAATAQRLMADLQPWAATETNINFAVWPATPEHRARSWSVSAMSRLRDIRRRYDPEKLMLFE
jgi:FAD/FMN-containing dehydrogenase